MNQDWFDVFQKLICPLQTAQLFLIFLGYFAVVRKQVSRQYLFYIFFLLGLIYYLVMKPVQEHSTSLLQFARYTRTFVLLGGAAPSLLIAASRQSGYNFSKGVVIALYACGAFLGIWYDVAVDLARGAKGVLYRCGIEIASTNNLLLKESTAQVAGALLLFLIPTLFLIVKQQLSQRNKHRMFFLLGGLVFAVTFAVGSLTEQWWIYYFGAFGSAPFWGWAIYQDIHQMKTKADQLAPLIREELLQNISTYACDDSKLKELFAAAEIAVIPNRFLVVRLDGESAKNDDSGALISKVVASVMQEQYGENEFLIMESGSLYTAICFYDHCHDNYSNTVAVSECIHERINQEINGSSIIGIGSCYSSLQELRYSYAEAFDVVHYAVRVDLEGVVTYSDIRPEQVDNAYPFQTRNELVEMVKAGSVALIPDVVKKLCSLLFLASRNDLALYKNRLSEVAFVVTDAALQTGVDAEKIEPYESAINSCLSAEELDNLIVSRLTAYTELVGAVPETYSNNSVDDAKRFIDSNIQKDFGVDEVAEHVGLSRSYFMSVFKKQMGMTVNQYVTQARISKAKLMLLSTSVTDTAFAVGFNDSNYFSKVFKKHVGMTPTEFQQSAKNG